MPTPDEQAQIGSNFDRVAPFYDRVRSLFFGSRLRSFERNLLGFVLQPGPYTLWIVGGGSNHLLKDMLANDSVDRVYYSELSQAMLDRSRARLTLSELDRVEFHHGEVSSAPWQDADVVILPFVLDCYTDRGVSALLDQIEAKVKPSTSLIVIDFSDTDASGNPVVWYKRAFVTLLYRYFQKRTNLPASKLPDIEGILTYRRWYPNFILFKFNGWIKAYCVTRPFDEDASA